MATRVDMLGKIAAKHRMPNGTVVLPANLTRTGVFIYKRSDGSTVRELRHPDDVFKVDSMATLESAAVVDGHPGMVTPENWRALSVGFPSQVKRDGKFLASKLVIHDQAEIALVDNGDRQELSCGYECEVTDESGEYNGEKYDARQRNIRYNHVGLGPKGWGRAGAEVSLKFDGVGSVEEPPYTLGMDPKDLQARLDAMTADYQRVVSERDALRGERDQARADASKEKARADQLAVDNEKARNDAKNIDVDGLVETRTKVIEGATLLMGKEKIDALRKDGKLPGSHELMSAALASTDPKFNTKESADYVRARFDFAVSSHTDARTALARVQEAVSDPKRNSGHSDGNADEDVVEKARTAHEAHARDAWKQDSPLSRKAN